MSEEVNLYENHDEGTGGWAEGTVWVGTTAFRYEVKHFDEPSQFGIDGGRISKLHVQRFTPTIKEVVHYDRGWDIEPSKDVNGKEHAAYMAILEKYN